MAKQGMQNMPLFSYDRIIERSDFCNFTIEREKLLKALENGHCTKLFAPRNFGKTSLLKNIICNDWIEMNENKRVFIYVEFYSVSSLTEVSAQLTQGFNKAMSQHRNIHSAINSLGNILKKLKVSWQPPKDSSSLGEFSLRLETGNPVIPIETFFDTIQNLHNKKIFEFALVFDEFQEIALIPKAEAIMREEMQKLSNKIPVVVCGSKQHLLHKIFNDPKKPFYNWGNTLELKKIPELEYTEYINTRFKKVNLRLVPEASAYIQQTLHHIPEQINRICDYIAFKYSGNKLKTISINDCQNALQKFVEESSSLFETHYSRLSANERKVVLAFAMSGEVEKINSQKFLKLIPNLTAAAISRIVLRLLNTSTLQQFTKNQTILYRIEDPIFALYIQKSGYLLSVQTW
jgi:uncharacterized protein